MTPPTRQYYYHMNECKAESPNDPDCVCWHDEGTGPLTDSVDSGRTWRDKPEPKAATTSFASPKYHYYPWVYYLYDGGPCIRLGRFDNALPGVPVTVSFRFRPHTGPPFAVAAAPEYTPLCQGSPAAVPTPFHPWGEEMDSLRRQLDTARQACEASNRLLAEAERQRDAWQKRAEDSVKEIRKYKEELEGRKAYITEIENALDRCNAPAYSDERPDLGFCLVQRVQALAKQRNERISGLMAELEAANQSLAASQHFETLTREVLDRKGAPHIHATVDNPGVLLVWERVEALAKQRDEVIESREALRAELEAANQHVATLTKEMNHLNGTWDAVTDQVRHCGSAVLGQRVADEALRLIRERHDIFIANEKLKRELEVVRAELNETVRAGDEVFRTAQALEASRAELVAKLDMSEKEKADLRRDLDAVRDIVAIRPRLTPKRLVAPLSQLHRNPLTDP